MGNRGTTLVLALILAGAALALWMFQGMGGEGTGAVVVA